MLGFLSSRLSWVRYWVLTGGMEFKAGEDIGEGR